MTAGPHDLTIEAGATWRRTVTLQDGGVIVPLAQPCYMDVREGQSTASTRVLRFDQAGGAQGGTIVVEVDGSLTLLADDAVTVALPAGHYWYDLFATQGGQPVRVLAGRVTVVANVSAATP